ncbi:MAG: hypothetical protein IKD80_01570 [Selenomonadaceae bacterium]|nr:hypothetical protein [Selenomonadaceae bacterium]
MDVRPARNINRMFILRARLVAGRLNVGTLDGIRPARSGEFLCYFLCSVKESRPQTLIEVQTFGRRNTDSAKFLEE